MHEEKLLKRIAELKAEKMRVFRAFCNAHSTLRSSGNDTRSFQDLIEAEAVILIETGEVKGMTWSDIEKQILAQTQ